MPSAPSPSMGKRLPGEPTEHVGSKLGKDGRWLPFKGATIIARPCEASDFFDALKEIQEQLTSQYAQYVVCTPKNSMHMTICEGPSPLKQWKDFATMEEASAWIYGRISEKKLLFPKEIDLEISGVEFDGTDYRIVFRDEHNKRAYDLAHNKCAEALDISDTNLGDFVPHITIGYGKEIPPQATLEEMRALAKGFVGLTVGFDAPVVTTFENMAAFDTVYELKAIAGKELRMEWWGWAT